jgi:hypothetical protein
MSPMSHERVQIQTRLVEFSAGTDWLAMSLGITELSRLVARGELETTGLSR